MIDPGVTLAEIAEADDADAELVHARFSGIGQLAKSARKAASASALIVQKPSALLGRGEAGIAEGAALRQVVEGDETADDAALDEIGREIARAGLGIVDHSAIHVDEIRVEMEHQRGLELAGVAHAARLRLPRLAMASRARVK